MTRDCCAGCAARDAREITIVVGHSWWPRSTFLPLCANCCARVHRTWLVKK